MAWVLQKKDSNEELRLLTNREYIVGRKDVDIILNNDQSISRKHAVLSISYSASDIACPSHIPVVTLKDTSKYGTTLNGEKVDKDGAVVKNGDKIVFGILENHWSATYKSFVCVTSFLQKEEKALVRGYLVRIGGHLVPEWTSQCTLLIMSDLSISIKVVNALVSLCHIVTAKFLADLVEAVENRTTEPNHKRYIPPLAEPVFQEDEVSFVPNRLRKTVFSEKKFFCIASKQLKKLQFSVTMAGGEVQLLDSCKGNLRSVLRDKEVCILQPSSEECKEEFVVNLTDQLENHSLRYISEAEIGLAILHCSTEKFCNPRGSGEKEFLLQPLQSQNISISEHADLPESVKMETCDTAESSFEIDRHSASDPFLQDTQECSGALAPKRFKRETSYMDERKVPAETAKDGRPGPSGSPDIFGEPLAGPSDTKTEDRRIDSDSEPSTSGVKIDRFPFNKRTSRGTGDDAAESKRRRRHSQIVLEDDRRNAVPKVQVGEKRKPVTNHAPCGFLCARNLHSISVKMEEDSLSNGQDVSFVTVKLKSLLRNRITSEVPRPVSNGRSKTNFKKFIKVLPKRGASSGRIITFQPPFRLRVEEQEPVSNPENGEPMRCTPSDSQSQSANLFEWPAHLK